MEGNKVHEKKKKKKQMGSKADPLPSGAEQESLVTWPYQTCSGGMRKCLW